MLDLSSPLDGFASPLGARRGISELSLFGNGLWYVPSDITTLTQDAAGTTPVTAATQAVGLALDKSKSGAGTNGAKRVNLLTYTEQFDNAAWTKTTSNAVTNSTTGPTGTSTADTVRLNAAAALATSALGLFTNSAAYVSQPSIAALTAASYTFTLYVKGGAGLSHAQLRVGTTAGLNPAVASTVIRLSDGVIVNEAGTTGSSVVDAGGGWWRVSLPFTATAAVHYCGVWFWNSSSIGSATGTEGFYTWGADLRLTSEVATLPAYQIITADWPSTMVGNHAALSGSTSFRPVYQTGPGRLVFDATDDRLLTALNPTAAGSIAVRMKGGTASKVAIGSQGASNGRAFIALAADGSLAAGIGADSTSTIKGTVDDRAAWVTGIVTWDGTTVNLYRNGVSVYSGAQNGAVNTTVPFMLGCLNNNATASAFWDGDIGASTVLDYAMSASAARSLSSKWSTIQ